MPYKTDQLLVKGSLQDLEAMQQLFVNTVRSVCSSDYDEKQISAWTSSVENSERWVKILQEQYVLIAKIDKIMIGFGSLQNSYIDLLYVHRDHQRKGVASNIYDELEKEALRSGQTVLFANVSKTAREFFISKGFVTTGTQTVHRKDVALTNYKMKKEIALE